MRDRHIRAVHDIADNGVQIIFLICFPGEVEPIILLRKGCMPRHRDVLWPLLSIAPPMNARKIFLAIVSLHSIMARVLFRTTLGSH